MSQKESSNLFSVPILFITYKRISTAKKVFNSIKKIKPQKLYFASNAPCKTNNYQDEKKKVAQVRNLINDINWNCKVIKIFYKHHLPVSKSIPKSINFFFKKEKEGIILEDDCLPSIDFYKFCKKMLKLYRNKNINVICGSRFSNNKNGKFYFSKYNHAWGWASWRKSWKKFDPKIKFWQDFKKTKKWKEINSNKLEEKYWTNIFDATYKGKINTWDYAWTACAWYYGQLSIIPPVKLINNIGFGPDATWTVQSKNKNNKILGKIKKTIVFKKIFQDKKKDEQVFYKHFKGNEQKKINKLLKYSKTLFFDPYTFYLKLKRTAKNVKKVH